MITAIAMTAESEAPQRLHRSYDDAMKKITNTNNKYNRFVWKAG